MPDRVVLITGASAGLGRACAEHLARLGHRVYGTSRQAPWPAAEASPGEPQALPMDVGDDASVRRAVELVLEREGRIDVLVNNAGVGLGGAVEDTSVDEAKALFETNFFGVLRVCRAVLPGMRARRSGLVVNVSSLGGLVTIPFQGLYSASKYAVESLSDALRMELRPFGVRVTVIEPGDFRTGFTASRVFAAASGEGSAYRERCRRAIAVMERDERNGADPRRLGELLARIVAHPAPRARYTAGAWGQRIVVAARRVLPGALLERGIRAVYRV